MVDMAYLQVLAESWSGLVSWGWVLLALFFFTVLIQLFVYWFILARAAWYRSKPIEDHEELPAVSVIICARNDYPGLEQNLPLILEQDYPRFEVVVVDDGSNDDSNLLLKAMCYRYSHLKVVTLGNSVSFIRGKKLPLSVGIKSASYDVLLLTDAVCRPASSGWIRNMAVHFSRGKAIVLGYCAYNPKPGFLNKLIRLDAVLSALRYGGMSMAGSPYMGVGQNLAYTRTLFYKVKGFTSHYNVIVGDDSLFVNQAAHKDNTATEMLPNAFTLTDPPVGLGEWIRQKARNMGSIKYYKRRHKKILGLFHGSHFLLYPLFALCMIWWGFSDQGYMAMAAFFVWMLSHVVIVKRASARLNEEKLSLISLPGDVLLSLLYAVFTVYAVLMKKPTWRQ